MKGKVLLCAFAVACMASALAGRVDVDFRDKKAAASWSLGTTEYNSARGRKFPDDSAVLASPAFDGAITSVTVVASFTQSVSNAPAINVWAGADLETTFQVASVTSRFSNVHVTNAFTFAAEDEIHALKFTSCRNGNERVNPFVVSVVVRWTGGALSMPENLHAVNVSSNSFTATWDTVEDAAGYAFRIWRNVVVPRTGDSVFKETFDGLEDNPENNNTDWSGKMDQLSLDVPGWTGAVVRHAVGCGGSIQFGTSSKAGSLLSPAIPAGAGLKLVVEGFFPGRATGTMPVKMVCGEGTNDVADVAFNKSLQSVAVDLPALAAETHLLFCSPTNGSDRRVRLELVEVVSNYVAAGVSEVDLPGWSSYETSLPSVDVTGLATGEYNCAVQAVAGTDRSAWSETVVVELKDETVRMIPLAVPASCAYTNDWNWLGVDGGTCDDGMLGIGLTLATANDSWNGKYSSVTNGYKYTSGGFYSAETAEESDRALVMRATGDYPCAFMVTMINRGNVSIGSFEVSYLGVQMFDGATNDVPRRLEAAWCTTSGMFPDTLADEGWTAVPSLDFAELSSVKAGPVFLTNEIAGSVNLNRGLKPGEAFSFRLLFPKGANAPALGLDDLKIRAVGVREPTWIFVR